MNTENNQKVFGIILTYNCAAFLEHTYNIIPKDIFDSIIVIDDGSEDDILEVSKRIGVPLYAHPHGGYGSNLKFGLQKAVELGADYIIEIHGDGQFASSIPEAIEKMQQGCDLVLGNRFYDMRQPLRDKMSLIRYLGNFSLSTLGRTVMGIKTLDLFTGFRTYSARLVEAVRYANDHSSNDYFYSFEIIALARFANLKICQVPARSFYNQEHTSISLWKGFLEIGQTPYILLLYILARLGIRLGIFARRK